MDFYARKLKKREIAQGCAFWGSEQYSPNFGGTTRQKLKFLGRE